jgi:hypothetical protein
MDSMGALKESLATTIQIVLSNPQGEIVECKNHDSKESSLAEADASSEEYLSDSPGFENKAHHRAQSLPDIFGGLRKGASGKVLPKIEDYFYKWRCHVKKRRSSSHNGEWTQKLTSPVSLGKMAEGFHKRNSVLEDSFMMEYNWSIRNKSTSY